MTLKHSDLIKLIPCDADQPEADSAETKTQSAEEELWDLINRPSYITSVNEKTESVDCFSDGKLTSSKYSFASIFARKQV